MSILLQYSVQIIESEEDKLQNSVVYDSLRYGEVGVRLSAFLSVEYISGRIMK